MKVFPELSKNAWLVLLTLSYTSATAVQIGRKTNLRLNRISEALNQLEQYNLIATRKRKTVLVLDNTLKSVLQQFLAEYSKERLVDCFEGKKLNTIFQILEGYDTITKLKIVTCYSVPTLKRIIGNLQRNLLIFQQKKGTYLPRDVFKPRIRLLYSSFFAYFANALEKHGVSWKKINVFGNTVLLESEQTEISGFARTGFSRFHEYKIGLLMTSRNSFVSSDKKQTMEEVFIHALAESKGDYRYTMYCTLFADLNRMTLKQLKNLPIVFRVENEAKQIFDYLASNGQTKTKDDFLTPYKEYLEVRRDYAG